MICYRCPQNSSTIEKSHDPAGAPFDALTFATQFELLLDGFAFGAKETSVASALAGVANTEISMGAAVLPAKGAFALKAAVMLCAPVDKEAVL